MNEKKDLFNNEEVFFIKNIKSNYFLKLIVSFLNSKDGNIYIGIDKNGNIFGIKDIQKATEKIQKLLKEILPICIDFINIERKKINNFNLLLVKIKKGTGFFYYLKKYGRSEKGCFEIREKKIKSIKESVIQNFFDNQLLDLGELQTSNKKLTFNFFNNFLVKNNKKELFFLLKTKDNKFNLIAELLSDKNDLIINLFIFFGKDKKEIFKHLLFANKCLIELYQDVFQYVKEFIKKNEDYTKKNFFDLELFNEALINACVHNYWKNNRSLSISIFIDRIEICSFKERLNKLNKNIFKGISLPINQKLMNIFMQCGIAKGIGYGVTKIVKKYGKKSYLVNDSFLVVSLPLKIKKNFFKDYRKEKLFNLIINNPMVTIKKIAQLLNLSTSTIVRELKKNNIVNKGSDKKSFWEINNN